MLLLLPRRSGLLSFSLLRRLRPAYGAPEWPTARDVDLKALLVQGLNNQGLLGVSILRALGCIDGHVLLVVLLRCFPLLECGRHGRWWQWLLQAIRLGDYRAHFAREWRIQCCWRLHMRGTRARLVTYTKGTIGLLGWSRRQGVVVLTCRLVETCKWLRLVHRSLEEHLGIIHAWVIWRLRRMMGCRLIRTFSSWKWRTSLHSGDAGWLLRK